MLKYLIKWVINVNDKLKKETKENIKLINKLIYKVKKINDEERVQKQLDGLIQIKSFYSKLLSMLKSDKNVIEERQNNYELIYALTSKALTILLPNLITVVDKRICERNHITTNLDENINEKEYNDLIVYTKSTIQLTEKSSDIEYVKIITDAINKIERAERKINSMNKIAKYKWNLDIPIDEYMEDLDGQKNYLKIIRSKINKREIGYHTYVYAISILNSHYKMIIESIEKILDCTACKMKGIDVCMELPDKTLYNTYKETIFEFMKELECINNKQKKKSSN